jgi:hypothetical protein
VTSEWNPQNGIYNVGDTIYLTSIFPKTLTDQVNPTIVVDYSNSAGIGGDIIFNSVDTISRQSLPAKDSFLFVSIKGAFSERTNNSNQGINFYYVETPTNYQFIGAIICRKKGIYGLGVANLSSNGIRGKNCTNAGFKMTVTNSAKHLALYQDALGITLDADAIMRGYAFRVQ